MKIIYKDIAVGAAEDAAFTSAEAAALSNLGILGVDETKTQLSTLEPNVWVLDGTTEILNDSNRYNIAFMSDELSREDCTFAVTPEIDIAFDEQYTSLGITLRFSSQTGNMCSEVEIIWYRAGAEVSRGTFYPNDISFFCANRVEAYDGIKIRFVKTWLPYTRARIDFIGFGITRTFSESELALSSLSAVQQIDPTNNAIPANAFDWSLMSTDAVEYLFQFKQPIEVYADGLVGVYYVETATRRTANQYAIKCTDAIGLLDNDTFRGGIYTNYNAGTLLREICGEIPLYIDESLTSKTVTGYIPEGAKRREALKLVCFALMAVADTSVSDGIKIYPLSFDSAETIEGTRIYYGTSIDTASAVTAVKVTAYKYTQGDGNNTVTVGGTKYAYTTTEYTANNPLATASDKANVKEYKNMTLVSNDIAQNIASYLLNWLMYRETHNLSFKLDSQQVGDYVQTTTDYGAVHKGIITKLTLKMSRITKATANVVGAIEGV